MTHDEMDTLIMNKFSGKDIPANISNVFEFGIDIGRHEVETELLETSKHDELSQKIAWDILERGVERGRQMALSEFAEWIQEKYSTHVVIDVESGVTIVAGVEYPRVISLIELLEMYKKERNIK